MDIRFSYILFYTKSKEESKSKEKKKVSKKWKKELIK